MCRRSAVILTPRDLQIDTASATRSGGECLPLQFGSVQGRGWIDRSVITLSNLALMLRNVITLHLSNASEITSEGIQELTKGWEMDAAVLGTRPSPSSCIESGARQQPSRFEALAAARGGVIETANQRMTTRAIHMAEGAAVTSRMFGCFRDDLEIRRERPWIISSQRHAPHGT